MNLETFKYITMIDKIISENASFIKDLLLLNDKISVSVVKKLYIRY